MHADESFRVLEVHGISKTFGATRALRDVEFSIDAGEVFAVLGQNGSGRAAASASSFFDNAGGPLVSFCRH